MRRATLPELQHLAHKILAAEEEGCLARITAITSAAAEALEQNSTDLQNRTWLLSLAFQPAWGISHFTSVTSYLKPHPLRL